MKGKRYSGRTLLTAAGALAFAALPTGSWAFDTWSMSIVGVTNSEISYFIGTRGFDYRTDGMPAYAAMDESWTGMDRNGNSQTMRYVGDTWTQSQFGRLKSRATGSVENSYYNEDNPIFYNDNDGTFDPNGSPDGLVSLGFAGFNDTLHYGGSLEAGYRARYLFHIDGVSTGYGTFASLSVKIADDPWEDVFFIGEGTVNTVWATSTHEINGITPQDIHVQFSDQFVLNTFEVEDGTYASGSANFGSTVTLSGIEVVDANGNTVGGWTVTADSGTNYPVPEPATMLTLGLGALAAVRRRRRS